MMEIVFILAVKFIICTALFLAVQALIRRPNNG